MSTQKRLVQAYMDGFRRSDHRQVLDCLHDDVVWDLHGHTRLVGKEAFDGEIENEAFTGSPTLNVDRLIEEENTVIATGTGSSAHTGGTVHRFAFCDVFTFTGDLISRVESYVIPLPKTA